MGKGLQGFCFALELLACSTLNAQSHTVTYVYTDPQGTVLADADASGTITTTFDYRPYGSAALGTSPNGPGYAGHVNDPDTGLVYMLARYYDPAVGRFVSVDPHPVSAGALFFLNRFVYANNAPNRYVDERGDKPGDKFATPEMAAYDALKYINDTSIATNHEYHGWITIVDRQFVATDPVQMKENGGVTASPGVPVVGDYHTHGNYSTLNSDGTFTATGKSSKDNLNSDQFSPDDIKRYDKLGSLTGVFRGYLATPGQKFMVYDAKTRQIYNLAQVVQQQQQRQQNSPVSSSPPSPPPSQESKQEPKQ